jgi:hypothetical protein
MKKVVLALVLMTSPAFAQIPNLAPAPPVDRVGDPVKCLPIGKTAQGEFVYSLDCRDIPVSTSGGEPQSVAPTPPATVPATVPPKAPESK